MERNYDTTKHMVYPRITEIKITYAESGTPTIQYVERMAIVDGGGQVRHIEGGAVLNTLDFAAIQEPLQLVHPATGQPIEGQTVTSRQLVLGLLAFLRADQLRRDTPPPLPEPKAEPEPRGLPQPGSEVRDASGASTATE